MTITSIALKEGVLKSVMQACRNVHPDEFIGVLKGRIVEQRGPGRTVGSVVEVSELLVAPFSEYAESWSGFSEWFLPTSQDNVGTIHSHPNGVLLPSAQDKRFWSSLGVAHVIAGAPYRLNSWRAFDASGKPIQARVIK
ncbi:MAG TPA: Mov34/MPN/PAD-1 family protein [Candidatus Norongarragalinales archaeon]|jgi:proteasome lid subunit RPN8/RPN11|nr:Mov34/MPN/PAD-1 family protein [Candidatus Norongarragalinales archaeon]